MSCCRAARRDATTQVHFMHSHGIDGVVLLNTQKDYASFERELPVADRGLLRYARGCPRPAPPKRASGRTLTRGALARSRRHYTAHFGGGLSGPPIFDRSLAQTRDAVLSARTGVSGVAGGSTARTRASARAADADHTRETPPRRTWAMRSPWFTSGASRAPPTCAAAAEPARR